MDNLLDMAGTLIPDEGFAFYKFVSRDKNQWGVETTTFADGIAARGYIQAVSLETAKELGINLANNYRIVYSDLQMQGINDQKVADRLQFADKVFEVDKPLPWFHYNGWTGCLVVELKNTKALPEPEEGAGGPFAALNALYGVADDPEELPPVEPVDPSEPEEEPEEPTNGG